MDSQHEPDKQPAAPFRPDTRVYPGPRIAWRIVDGQAVLVVVERQELHTLNPVGTCVWQLLDGRTIGEIADAVVERFRVDSPTARQDVLGFINRLGELGAVRARDAMQAEERP